MSSDVVISAQSLCKSYHLYKRPEDRLKQALFGARRKYYSEVFAVRDVSLEVRRGETVGIVGRNGSGKSTLLQLICGTLTPTSGDVAVKGRIAPLLELGAGFNPEFTGRENVFFNAAVIGMTENEIRARYESIAAFAGIGDHIEHPVKTYSSGMFSRLAFAVAIHVEPEILVIDEALSVGDEAFQKKCFSKIEELREKGVTVLFVSHSAGTVIDICDRAVLLDGGELLVGGAARDVVSLYQKLAYSGPSIQQSVRDDIKTRGLGALRSERNAPRSPLVNSAGIEPMETRERFDPSLENNTPLHYESRGAEISNCCIKTVDGRRVNVLAPARDYFYEYDVSFSADAYRVSFGMMFKSMSGAELGGLGSHDLWKGVELIRSGTIFRARFRFRNIFLPGTYFLNAGCTGWIDGEEAFLDRIIDAAPFRVEETGTERRVAGIVNFATFASCEVSEISTEKSKLVDQMLAQRR